MRNWRNCGGRPSLRMLARNDQAAISADHRASAPERVAHELAEQVFFGLSSVVFLGTGVLMLMSPLLSGCFEASKRIRRNNSVRNYGEIPSISR
jgi:hypothetical protein